jgi:hypothetical protein
MIKFKDRSENKLKCIFETFINFALYLIFRFEKWHFKSSYHCHPYKKITRDIIVDSSPDVIVEIGCGLGDILKSLPKSYLRLGSDIDHRVIKAAKAKHRNDDIRFYNSVQCIPNSVFTHKRVTLVCVNWLHELSRKDLITFFDETIRTIDPHTVIIDRIIEQNNHRTRHDFNFLKNYSFSLQHEADEPEDIRILTTWIKTVPYANRSI